MDPSKMTTQEVMIYAALFNAAIGLVLGLFPLVLGFAKGCAKYGVIGLLTCLVGGAILGVILSLPAMVFFTWLILRGSRAPEVAQEVDSSFEN